MKNKNKTAGFLSVLRNPDFLKLWLGQIISYVGDRITQIALLGWLIASGQKTGTEMAHITFFNMLPGFIFGQIAGAFADRLPRKTVMIVSDVLRAVLIFMIALFVTRQQGSSLIVYFLVFLSGLCTAFFYPAKLSIIPNLVKVEELQAANALSTVTGMVATLLGTYFAGVLIERFGLSSGFFVNGMTYVISAAAILWIHYKPQPINISPAHSIPLNVFQDFQGIVKYLKAHRRGWNLILLSTFLSLLSSFFYISLTVLAVDYFKLGTEGVGKLLTMLGVGMIVGAFAAIILKKWFKAVDLLGISFLVIFFTTLTAESVHTFAMAWVWLIFLGAANSIIMVIADTLLQRITPDRFRGKVFGFRSVLTNAAFLLSLLGVSEILNFTSPFAVFKALALISLILAFVILFVERKLVHYLTRSFCNAILKTFFAFEVEGEEHFRYQSKTILAGNHTGFLDSPILVAASKRPVKFLVAQSVFSWPLIGRLVKAAGVIPVVKGKGREAIAQAVNALQTGKAVGIFPEGKLSTDGKIGKFHRGVAKLHLESKAPIVPFVIQGGYEAWHWGQALPKFRKIILQFGQPIENFDGSEEDLVEEVRSRVEFMKEALERRERSKNNQVYMDSVLSLIQMKSDIYGARTALSMKEGNRWNKVSYIELSRKAKDLSNYLIEKNIKRSDRIAILSESRPEWGIVFFAAMRAGAVLVPLDIKLTSTELVSILSDAEPRILFISSDFVETARLLKPLISSLEEIVVLTPDKSNDFSYYETLKSKTEFEGRDRDQDETALIIYTSGTTGNPKGVMTTFGNLVFQVRNFETLMNLGLNDTFLSILPMNHLLELTGGFLGVLHAGGRICYCESLYPQEIAAIMREKKITYMITVPIFLKVLKGSIDKEIRRLKGSNKILYDFFCGIAGYIPGHLKKILFHKIHVQFGGRFKGFIAGGAPLDIEVGRFFNRIGIPVYQGYGLTETSPVITVNWPGNNRLGSVGKPLSGGYVKILKSDENQEEGEILTKGPHVMKGYFKRADLTSEVIDEQRWFHTGDLGKIDKDGFLYITGRIKNLIVLSGGKKVHPEEVEIALSQSDAIKEICVLGKKSKVGAKEGTEEVVAVIVPSDLLKRKAETLEKVTEKIGEEIKRLGQNLATYKRPSRIFIHPDELPKTATRKIKRPLVLKWLENEEASV